MPNSAKSSEAFYKKMRAQAVFLINEFENAVIRSEPGADGFFVKFKGEKEFKAKQESGVVAEALADKKEITQAQYEQY